MDGVMNNLVHWRGDAEFLGLVSLLRGYKRGIPTSLWQPACSVLDWYVTATEWLNGVHEFVL